MSMQRQLIIALLLTLALFGCQRRPAADSEVPVAHIGDRALTVADLERYFEQNLLGEPDDPETSEEDRNRIKSRLFDAFVEEQVLRAEARRVEPGGSFPDRSASPTPEETREYLNRHREAWSSGEWIELSALMLASIEQARELGQKIRKSRLSFDDAAATHEVVRGQTRPRLLPWQALSSEVRTALEGLTQGQVSAPLVLDGNVFLFRVESAPQDGPPKEGILLRRAQAELESVHRDAAYGAFLQRARSKTSVRLETGNLPFSYVPDSQPTSRMSDRR